VRSSGLGLRSEILGPTVTLFVAGEIDMLSAVPFSRSLDVLMAMRPEMLCIDMTDVTFCDSTGFRVLVKTAALARERGCEVVTRGVRPGLMRVVDILGVQVVLGIAPSPPGDDPQGAQSGL